MTITAHVASRIHDFVANAPTVGYDLDAEAARYGGIGLLGDLGSTWLLRPDGSFWTVNDDFGLPLAPLPESLHAIALVYGAERYPFLTELLPVRPVAAPDCSECSGSGGFVLPSVFPPGTRTLCSPCNGLGWLQSHK